ncbi:hypothetical protein PIB30_053783 [Stylosanthes scabra]|uniref:Uncharacterized protein n=1 Tax=Stylosanthes scabra TaxID=79078 RepID=A0ABU6VI69_9FABA|nr:hypothetical protein [Stylosanthes scabra]
MTKGVVILVNLPRVMRDVMLKRPTGNSRYLLPYPIFVSRFANHYQVPEFPRDEIIKIREVDMYCPYGDWKGEQARVHRGRLIPPAQGRLLQNTQTMIRQAFPDMVFKGLVKVSSAEGGSDGT